MRVLILMGRYTQGRGTGRTTLDRQSCGSTLLQCVSPENLRFGSLSGRPNAQPPLPIMTSHIFSLSTQHRLAVITLGGCSRLTCGTPPPRTHDGFQIYFCICPGLTGRPHWTSSISWITLPAQTRALPLWTRQSTAS